jgi:hypothetical protein
MAVLCGAALPFAWFGFATNGIDPPMLYDPANAQRTRIASYGRSRPGSVERRVSPNAVARGAPRRVANGRSWQSGRSYANGIPWLIRNKLTGSGRGRLAGHSGKPRRQCFGGVREHRAFVVAAFAMPRAGRKIRPLTQARASHWSRTRRSLAASCSSVKGLHNRLTPASSTPPCTTAFAV